MSNIEQLLGSRKVVRSRPELLSLGTEFGFGRLENLLQSGQINQVIDDYLEQEREYFQVCHPDLVYAPDFEDKFQQYLREKTSLAPLWQQGIWVFYPWLSTLVHVLPDEAFQSVRTARNCNLINESEQKKFYNATVGVAGLSVGNSVALAIVLQGGARRIKLADHDRLALSNLNRIRAGVGALGLPKVEMTARQIYELNPYAEVELFSEGLSKENIEKFFSNLDVVIDEIDNLAVKYLIREQAKKNKLPVVMAADLADKGIIDIERYDLDPQPEFFHGRMGEVSYESLSQLDKFGIGKMIAQLLGKENETERMGESLREMGKSIVSWPQLGGTALLNGSAVAYCVRKILNGQPLERNRAIISLDKELDSITTS